MEAVVILYPTLFLVLLTLGVWLSMLVRRALHMRAYGITPHDMPTREAADLKLGAAQAPNNNLMNLFELPVLFYVASILIFQLNSADKTYLIMSWIFVLLRCAHSAIHITYNNVIHRGFLYLSSACVLWLIWFRLAYQVVTKEAI